MDRKLVKEMLPVIIAFAEGRTIQYRGKEDLYRDSFEWRDINPDTTEFRLNYPNPDQWRVKPE